MFHMSEGGCALVLQKDLEYWCIDELTMEPCCALKYYPQIDVCQSEKDGDIAAKKLEMELATEEDFGNSCLGRMRSWTWNTFEYPWTSKVAQVMAFLSLFMVVVSTFTLLPLPLLGQARSVKVFLPVSGSTHIYTPASAEGPRARLPRRTIEISGRFITAYSETRDFLQTREGQLSGPAKSGDFSR